MLFFENLSKTDQFELIDQFLFRTNLVKKVDFLLGVSKKSLFCSINFNVRTH
jgi:hypothetical protein